MVRVAQRSMLGMDLPYHRDMHNTLLLAQELATSSNEWGVKEWAAIVAAVVSAIAIGCSFFFLQRLPNLRRKTDLALELYKLYSSDGMQRSRRIAWKYLHDDECKMAERVAIVWNWGGLFPTSSVKPDDIKGAMAVRRVFDFFASCEECLARRIVDEPLLVAMLGHSFSRWSYFNIEMHVRNPSHLPKEIRDKLASKAEWLPHEQAGWRTGLPTFRRACGYMNTAQLGDATMSVP